MAMAFSWGGKADTEVSFGSFFHKDHTLVLRFMPQYPDSYVNVIVGHRSTVVPIPGTAAPAPFFAVGQGTYSTADPSPTLFLRVGTKEVTVKAPLKGRTWHHLAVTRQGDTFKLFLDATPIGNAVTQAAKAPAGTRLRFGSTANWQALGSGLPPQFYGLLDDVAVFDRVLSSQEIAGLAEPTGVVTSLEKSLVAFWTFPTKLPPPTVKLPPAFRLAEGNAGTQAVVSLGHDSKEDAAKLLFPPPEHRFHLPCAKGQILWVAQDPSMLGASHAGTKNFISDIKAVTLPAGVDLELPRNKPPVLPGIAFQASAAGEVLFVDGSHPSGKVDGTNELWTSIDGQSRFFWRYLHWAQSSAKVSAGDHVAAGTNLAVIGDTGVDVANIHLHYGLFWFPAGEQPPADPGLLSVPFAYKDYFLLERSKGKNGTFKDTWKPVAVGMPKRGDVVTWGSHP